MSEKGKGGNFNTQKNPFVGRSIHLAPSLGDEAMLGRAIDAILEKQCAIIIGGTRDGGAIVLTILDGDDRHRTYCATAGELSAAIEAILAMYGK